jgi:hypothetical protein
MAEEIVSDAPPVTSTVEVQGVMTIRTYSDGAIQRNVWETTELAQEYADSVAEQGA